MVILIERIAVFLFQFSLLILVLYGVGSFQEFLDRSQTYLLHALIASTLLGGILCIYMIIYLIVAAFVIGIESKSRVLLFTGLLLFNAAVFAALRLFSAWF